MCVTYLFSGQRDSFVWESNSGRNWHIFSQARVTQATQAKNVMPAAFYILLNSREVTFAILFFYFKWNILGNLVNERQFHI